MAVVNLSELNLYIKNFYDRVGLRELEADHAERVRLWLIDNLTLVGRYSVRDQERFGCLESWGKSKNDNRPVHVDRTDGWQALTEEVPDIDHLTYGTGILYIHGEMEMPQWWEDLGGCRKAGDHIYDDEFHHVNYSGTQKFFYKRVKNDVYSFWYEPEVETRGPYTGSPYGPSPDWGDQGEKWGYLWEENPIIPPMINIGTAQPTGRSIPASFSDPIAWYPNTLYHNIGGDNIEEVQGEAPDGENDADIYHLDNERNHYPYRIIQSGTPVSIKNTLDYLDKNNGMYDGSVPPEEVMPDQNWPPINGHKFVKQGKKGILNFFSPIEEGFDGGSDEAGRQEYAAAYFFRTGVDVFDRTTWPGEGTPVPVDERGARGFNPEGKLFNSEDEGC